MGYYSKNTVASKKQGEEEASGWEVNKVRLQVPAVLQGPAGFL
jgi:hypothetical protein